MGQMVLELPEDEEKGMEKEIQDLVNTYNVIKTDVDDLIKKLKKYESEFLPLDEEERKEIYKEAQKLIAEDAPMAFLYMNSFTVAMRDNVKGYTVQPTAATIFMKNVYFE